MLHVAPAETLVEEPRAESPLPLPDALKGSGFAECLTIVLPQIQLARERVRRGAQTLAATHSLAPFDPHAIESSLASVLAGLLLQMVTRVMVLEVNVARLQGLLAGDTPEQRFNSFINRLQRTEITNELLSEYPVLLEQIVNRLSQWENFSLEFLRHLCEDWDHLRRLFFRSNPGRLVMVSTGVGDTHRNGRSVVVATFENGERLVYKPRSMAVDEHFQQLLSWLNDRGAQPQFRLMHTLGRGDHGWSEFIAPGPCSSAAELSRFYQRQGGYLAVLYAVEACDFHCENLIAVGEHPFLIDLEALFHPRLETSAPESATRGIGDTLGYSALRVGLLPMCFWSGDGDMPIDLSGLGSAAGQLTPNAVPQWERPGTDEMRIVRKRMNLPDFDNCPVFDGEKASPFDYADSLATGFAGMYRLLLDQRSELLSVLECFANDEVRVVARRSLTYGTLLHESFHPDLLRNAPDRDAFFLRLQEGNMQNPVLERLLPAELSDLHRGDIPLFTARPASRHLWTSSGECLENVFDDPGLTHTERRLERLSEADLERQLWIVRASVATMSKSADHTEVPSPGLNLTYTSTSRDFVSAAREVGDRICEIALGDSSGTGWLGLNSLNEQDWFLSPLGPGLYDGLPGVSLFLAWLGEISGHARYSQTARSAIETLRDQLKGGHGLQGIGGFAGLGGVLYCYAHLGVLWNDTSLLDAAEALLDPIEESIGNDPLFDVIGGAAGCILAIRSLTSDRSSHRVTAVVRKCGDHLLETCVESEQGKGWLCAGNAHPLTGFAHGNAGIGFALLAAAAATGDPRFREAALAAFDYERRVYSPERGKWPDLRANSRAGFVTAWCHGAPGIGLSRLCSLAWMDDAVIRAEIDAALTATVREGFGRTHMLCHGDLGNADILLEASEILQDPRWRAHANREASRLIDSAPQTGWRCGTPLNVESPGLLTGLAGIGYALLRQAEPSRVPCILALAPPRLSQ